MLSIIFTDISSWCLIIFAPCTVAGWVCIVVCIFNLCNWLHKYLWCSQAGRTENRVARKVWKCFFPILFCFVFYFISFYYYQWAAWRATLILASWGWWSVSSHHTITNLWLPQGMNENKKKKKKGFSFAEYLLRFLCGLWGRKAPDGKRDVKYLLRASRTPVGLLLHLVRVRNLKFIKLLCLWLEWSCLEFFVRDSAIFLLAKLISGKTCYHSFVFSKTLSFAQFVVS